MRNLFLINHNMVFHTFQTATAKPPETKSIIIELILIIIVVIIRWWSVMMIFPQSLITNQSEALVIIKTKISDKWTWYRKREVASCNTMYTYSFSKLTPAYPLLSVFKSLESWNLSLSIRTKCLLNFYILFRWLSINNNLYNNNIQKENPQKETYTRDIQQKEKEMNYSLSR